MLGDSYYFGKNFWFMLGEIGKNFAVEFNASFYKAVDKFVVGEAVLASGGADLDLPEATGPAFLFAAVIELK